uniref:clarin-1-like isoform X2 n=1 Tax=Oncorhynchus gorbuscha TaxID=8017 RepID=UPI001EAED5A1|nr:clarin-1-like isoform X2 [Oncorhynchus gorbuscha]
MPNRQKKIMFSVAGVLSFGCVLIVAAAMGSQFWVQGTMLCTTGAQLVNATGQELDKFVGRVNYGLFHGQTVKQCGLGGRIFRFSCFFVYNAFGSPYETLHGALGLYLWNFVCCLCSCLVMILFASEVKLHRLSDHIANFNEGTFMYKTHTEQFDHSFWLIFLTFLVHGLNILLIRVAGIQFPFQEAKESNVNTGASDLMY